MEMGITIHGLVTGESAVPLHSLFVNMVLDLRIEEREKFRPFAYKEVIRWPDGSVTDGKWSPIPIWYIKGADKKILVDTSFNSVEHVAEVRSARGEVFILRREPRWEIRNALSTVGVKPEDIDIVIHTHLHWDHCGNDGLFTKASFIAQREELALALTPPPYALHYQKELTKGILDVLDRFRTINGDVTIVDGVELWKLGGHTPGSMAVAVKTDVGLVALIGDVIGDYKNLELNWPGPAGNYWSLDQLVKAYRLVKKKADIIIPGHDWKVWSLHPEGKIG